MPITRAQDGFLKKYWWFFYAQAKAGKSVLAATLSKLCPDVIPVVGKPVFLADTLVLQWDQNATESLIPMGLDCPVLDMFDATGMDMRGYMKRVAEMHGDIAAEVKKGVLKNIIFDTLGTADATISRLQAELTPPEGNTSVYYKQVANKHQQLIDPLKALGLNIVVLAHMKSNVAFMDGKETQSERVRRKVDGLSGAEGALFNVGITGQTAAYYIKQSSMIAPLLVEENKKDGVTRSILPYGGFGYAGGCRYPGLETKEPAHLGLLAKKIKSLHVKESVNV